MLRRSAVWPHIVALSLTGCASTKMTTFADPAAVGHHYSAVVVVANVDDLAWRGQMEAALVEQLQKLDLRAYRGMELFPPTRTRSDQEAAGVLLGHGVDAVLVASVTEAGVTQAYIPPTTTSTTTGTSKATVFAYPNVATGHGSYEQKTTTRTSGGYTVSKAWAGFSCRTL